MGACVPRGTSHGFLSYKQLNFQRNATSSCFVEPFNLYSRIHLSGMVHVDHGRRLTRNKTCRYHVESVVPSSRRGLKCWTYPHFDHAFRLGRNASNRGLYHSQTLVCPSRDHSLHTRNLIVPFHHWAAQTNFGLGPGTPLSNISPSKSTSSNAFQYTPLDDPERQIRLMDIHDGEIEDDIQVSLRVVEMDTDEEYTAMSYAWGEPIFNRSIVCNGKEKLVTENLLTALRWLRHYKVKTCWVDAICIDQSDEGIPERSKQVSHMGKVFGSALRVIAYLGEGNDDVRAALRLAADVAAFGKECGILDATTSRRLIESVTDKGPFQRKFPANGSSQWDHFEELFYRTWFSRLWVLQEVVLADQIDYLCAGRLGSFWDLIYSWEVKNLHSCGPSAQWIYEHTSFVLHGVERSHLFDEVWSGEPYLHVTPSGEKQIYQNTILERLRSTTRVLKCTDPRDKLYGVAGLDQSLPLQPDYSASVRDVYTNFALEMIRRSPVDAHRILHYSGRQFHSALIPDLPSWVPDWTYDTRVYDHRKVLKRDIPDAKGSIELTDDDNLIRIKGAIIDCIEEIGIIAPSLEHMWHELLTTDESNFVSRLKTYETMLKASVLRSQEDQVIGHLAHIMSDGFISSDKIQSYQDLEEQVVIIATLFADQAIALTRRKNIAVVGSKARVGDMVVHVSHSDFQLLLRPTSRSDQAMELICNTRTYPEVEIEDVGPDDKGQYPPGTVFSEKILVA